MSRVLLLDAADVRAVFDLPTALESQRAAFRAMGQREARLAPRLLLEGGADGSVAFCYAARTTPEAGPVCKFGSVNPGNAALGLPGVSALVVALDPATGRPAAVLDGTSLTTLRTAAATAVAAEHLAGPAAGSLAVFGCGVQGEAHVRALARVLPLRHVQMWAPRADRREAVATSLARELDLDVVAARSPEAAVRAADVVVTCTTSHVPVFSGAWVSPGSTVLSVGSFAPDRCETDLMLLARAAAVVVDDVRTACAQAGPVVEAVNEGLLDVADIVPLGDVVVGPYRGRGDPGDIVFYNSVGIGVQDAAAAWAVVQAARAEGRGHEFSF